MKKNDISINSRISTFILFYSLSSPPLISFQETVAFEEEGPWVSSSVLSPIQLPPWQMLCTWMSTVDVMMAAFNELWNEPLKSTSIWKVDFRIEQSIIFCLWHVSYHNLTALLLKHLEFYLNGIQVGMGNSEIF